MKVEVTKEQSLIKNQRNSSLDFLKLFCAFLIVLFHCEPAYSKWTQAIANCAVPCFFMISGYLIYSEKINERCIRSIKKTAKILLWSTLFYMPLLIYGIYTKNTEIQPVGKLLLNFIVFNDNPAGVHLWYLSAYIYVLAVVYFLNKNNKLNILYYSIPFLWIADMIGGRVGVNTIYLRNFLFEGLPCFGVGMLVRRFNMEKFVSIELLVISIVALCAGCILESYLYESSHQTVSTSLLAIPLLLLFLSLPQNRFEKIMSHVDINDSLYIYIFHPAVIILFVQINKFLPEVWTNKVYPFVSPLVVFVSTYVFIIAFRYVWLSSKNKTLEKRV